MSDYFYPNRIKGAVECAKLQLAVAAGGHHRLDWGNRGVGSRPTIMKILNYLSRSPLGTVTVDSGEIDLVTLYCGIR